MGKRQSRPVWRPPPPPPVAISIPNFPFPPRILNYLLSQSAGFSISFSSPSGSSGALSSNPIQNPASYDLNIPTETTKPRVKSPPPKDVPAYLTTFAPTQRPQPTNPVKPPIPKSNVNLPGNIPPIWVAAIRSMEFVNNRAPIDSDIKLNSIYNELGQIITAYMGSGVNAVQNTSALVFFCTSIGRLFSPFQEKFVYNYLNMKYPTIFVNSEVYRKVVIINCFANKLNKLFDYNGAIPGNGYISKDDRVMLYAVSNILKEVIPILEDTNPILNLG